ncbi:hypothetical protein [Streptomyces mirabilis]|uniref:hypothetical protein n=1 Tax=Streptomyces mirabilis TaxID=68239 RepID=UPI0022591C1B|nr:hypothetical protein [Streptomyces mirabilis]MCX4425941.1 hypothetical protein [Streptomyces mirabilis]
MLGPVRVLLRADQRDVAGAQFLGERGEDHRLEVLAHELPRTGLLSTTVLRQFGVAKEMSTCLPSSSQAVMYSPRTVWCRWARASASSTLRSPDVSVNSSFSAGRT